jgi:hypothetical protein
LGEKRTSYSDDVPRHWQYLPAQRALRIINGAEDALVRRLILAKH